MFFQASETDDLTHSASTSATPRRESFKRPLSKADQVLDKIAKRIDSSAEKPVLCKEKYMSFGDHVAEKLRCMPPEMVSITQKLISDAIFYDETKQLNMTSRIATDLIMPPRPIYQHYDVSRSPSIASFDDPQSTPHPPSNSIIEAYTDAILQAHYQTNMFIILIFFFNYYGLILIICT